MNLFIHRFLALLVFIVLNASGCSFAGSDIGPEPGMSLGQFRQNMYKRRSTIPGFNYNSWSVPLGPHTFYVALSAPFQSSEFGKALTRDGLIVLAHSQGTRFEIVIGGRNSYGFENFKGCEPFFDKIASTMSPYEISSSQTLVIDEKPWERIVGKVNIGKQDAHDVVYQCHKGTNVLVSILAHRNPQDVFISDTGTIGEMLDGFMFARAHDEGASVSQAKK